MIDTNQLTNYINTLRNVCLNELWSSIRISYDGVQSRSRNLHNLLNVQGITPTNLRPFLGFYSYWAFFLFLSLFTVLRITSNEFSSPFQKSTIFSYFLLTFCSVHWSEVPVLINLISATVCDHLSFHHGSILIQ